MFTLEAMKLLGIACSGYYGFAKLYPSLLPICSAAHGAEFVDVEFFSAKSQASLLEHNRPLGINFYSKGDDK